MSFEYLGLKTVEPLVRTRARTSVVPYKSRIELALATGWNCFAITIKGDIKG